MNQLIEKTELIFIILYLYWKWRRRYLLNIHSKSRKYLISCVTRERKPIEDLLYTKSLYKITKSLYKNFISSKEHINVNLLNKKLITFLLSKRKITYTSTINFCKNLLLTVAIIKKYILKHPKWLKKEISLESSFAVTRCKEGAAATFFKIRGKQKRRQKERLII